MQRERPPERRAIQRDWVGHIVQAAVIVVTIIGLLGVPLLIWGNNVNTTLATSSSRLDRDERDITDQRQSQIVVNNQLSTLQNTLTRIDTQLETIRESVKPKR